MNTLSKFVLGHKRLVALLWLAVFVAGVVATPHVTNRLSQEFSLPGQKGFEADVAIVRDYGNGGATVPLVPVVSLPDGTSAESPQARAGLAAGFGATARIPGLRVVSYASTGDSRFVSSDGRVTFGLVFAPRGTGFQGDAALAPDITREKILQTV